MRHARWPPARARAPGPPSGTRPRRRGRRPCRRAGATSALALGELRPLAGLLEPGLLALLDARIAREEAAALELRAQVRVRVDECARDAVAQGAGLGGHAAAVELGHDVHAVLVAHGLERLADVALQREAREVLLERAAVDDVGARARLEDHARDGGLALARGAVARAGGEVDLDRDRLAGDVVFVGVPAALVLEVLVVARAVAAQRG